MQEVFVRLCKDDFRLLKTYDPARAGLTTWLTIVARSTARDVLRRRHPATTPIDAVPEAQLAVEDRHFEPLKLPDALLSPRQKLVLTMLYDRDMEVAEIAAVARRRPSDGAQHPSQGDAQAAHPLRSRRRRRSGGGRSRQIGAAGMKLWQLA